jgi:hypothetical protein
MNTLRVSENNPIFAKNYPMHLLRILLPMLLLIVATQAQSQLSKTDSAASIPFFYGFYGYQWPGADMATQFGSNSVIGPGFMVKTRSNWLFGAEYDFLFGNNVKNGLEIFKGMMTSDGNVISGDGTPALVALFERGSAVGVKFGKLIPVSKKDKNSGIFFTLGLGYINHKIRIEVENQSAPQLKGDYKRGYDRLSGGLMLNQSIGFMYFGKSRLLNFTLSVEATEGWVKPYREYYFDLMAPPPEDKQFDLLIGPKIAWMIPLRQRGPKEFYYY